MEKTKLSLVLAISETGKSRSSSIQCYAFFQNGDQLFEFLVQLPFKVAEFPRYLEDKYYSSSQVAKVSDYYFGMLKYIMDIIGVSNFLVQRSNGFLNLIPMTTGMLVFATIVYVRPDYTFLSKVFTITSPHVYSLIVAINSYISLILVGKCIDLVVAMLNVLTGIWSTDFFSRGQTWATTERILNNAKCVAKITILTALESIPEAQNHLLVHKKLLLPLESYFNPSQIENMNLIPSEFSHSDMNLLGDKLNELDELSQFKEARVPVQMMLFLLVCKELKVDFTEKSSAVSEVKDTKKKENKGFSLCKKILKVLVYRSPTIRPLRRASRIFASSRSILNFAKDSREKGVIKQRNLTNEHLGRCFKSKLEI